MDLPSGALSVCVPAFDEALSLPRALSEIGRQSPEVVAEILVCANGCTDGTEQVVLDNARRDRRIRLLESGPGKPRAWNALLAAASGDHLAFCDADNRLAPEALPRLLQALRRQTPALVVAAVEVPDLRGARGAARLWGLGAFPFGHDYLSGRLYAFCRSRLTARLVERGFAGPEEGRGQLPEELVHEDVFLEMLLGPGELEVVPEAVVRFEPGSLEDLARYRARIVLAREQLAQRWPEHFAAWRHSRGTLALGRVPGRLASLWRSGTLGPALAGLLVRAAALRTAKARTAAQRLVAEARRSQGQDVMRGPGRAPRGRQDEP